MRTVGVDLAAEPMGTAVATIDWSAGQASLSGLVVGAEDSTIVDAITQADKAGIDCPLGWPAPFVAFVAAHHSGHVTVPHDLAGRRRLAYRETDFAVRATTGRWPLSVATDRIGRPAMRAAGLLARLASGGHPVDRSGEGVVVEVYPAASLRLWKLPDRGYKGPANLAHLSALVDRLREAADWLALGAYEDLCRVADHAVDAVIAAMTARAAAQGLTAPPRSDQLVAARSEGWIALPIAPIGALKP